MATVDLIRVEVTCPDGGVARRIARAAVEARLAACAHVAGTVQSLYWWDGRIAEDAEVVVELKTRAELFGPLAELIAALHPYRIPAILALPLRANAAYAAWVEAETRAADTPA